MLINIFTSVSVEWRDVCDIQLIMGKDVGDDTETLKTPGSPKHISTVSTKDLLNL